jgi:exopolyphosphatase/guanosine-5'-triphosphate,3'-diphosphate pyrophosphatase
MISREGLPQFVSPTKPATPEDQSHRVAVIDLGSNTNRLVVMNTRPGYSYRLEDEVREVVRLRKGMTKEGLSPKAIARGLSTLRLFKNFCDRTQVNVILAVATSAVREAANGPQFVQRVEREIGLKLQVLDGEREAYYDALGALNEVPITEGVVLDIGGGSIQLCDIQDRHYQAGDSLTLGALALTERFVEHDPITDREYQALQQEINRQLDQVSFLADKKGQTLVGLGGTIRNLAKIETKRLDYPLETLHGFTLSRNSVEQSLKLFRELPLSERSEIPGLSSDRADIILPGALVLLMIMDRLDLDEVAISVNGIREGVFFEYFWKHLASPIIPSVRRFSVLNLARNYQYEKDHANHVRFLAGRIFEQLIPIHGYGINEKRLLDTAALLHDMGRIIGYSRHHKHSQTLIENNGLPGFTPREAALIGLLTRYHRKGNPDIDGYRLLLDEDDEVLLIRLAAILRTAECLERGRNANVNDVVTTWNDENLRLTLITNIYPTVELWQAERNAIPLLAKAFQRQVTLDSFAPPVNAQSLPEKIPSGDDATQ